MTFLIGNWLLFFLLYRRLFLLSWVAPLASSLVLCHWPGLVNVPDLQVKLVESLLTEDLPPSDSELVQLLPDLCVGSLKHKAEPQNKILFEKLVVRTSNVLTDGVYQVHYREHELWLDPRQPGPDHRGHHCGKVNLLLGHLGQGFDQDSVVIGEP